jgi:hypothetical protein
MFVEINDEQRHNRLLSHSIIVVAGSRRFSYTPASLEPYRRRWVTSAFDARRSTAGPAASPSALCDERGPFCNAGLPMRPSRHTTVVGKKPDKAGIE